MSKTLIDTIKEAELAYVKEFTQFEETDECIIFTDPSLPGMDHHNFTYIKEGLSREHLAALINREVKRRQDEDYTSAFFISDFKIDEVLFKDFPYEIEYLEFLYMATPTSTASLLKPREDFLILPALSEDIMQDGIDIDIIANTIYMGDFAKKRIERKVQVYRDAQKKTNLFVGYYKDKPIGNCELYIYDDISKLEDFDIIEDYQRKGFGTRFLKHLLIETEKHKVDQMYLVTDKDDTAQEMYKKNHFETIGYKYEAYIDFKKTK